MDIAALSMEMSSASLGQAVSVAVTKKAMDGQEAAAVELIKQLEQANPAPPRDGHLLNLRA